MGIVYRITNLGNRTTYIGSTCQPVRARWGEHIRRLRRGEHGNEHLQRAWNKYGASTFEFRILREVDDAVLLEREQYWLDQYRLIGSVYNMGLVARNPMIGRKHTPEARRKISEASKKYWADSEASGEARRRLSEAKMGCKLSAETKRKIGEAQKGKKVSAQTRRRMSKALKGRRKSLEHRRKLGDAHRGKRLSEEHRRKISNGLRGRHYSEETRQKIARGNAKVYPAFCNQAMGEIIPAGYNLSALCRERNLNESCMRDLVRGRLKTHREWVLK